MQNPDRQGPSLIAPHNGEKGSLVGLYFRDASRHQLLSDESERRLARKLVRSLRVISEELNLPPGTQQTLREVVGSQGKPCATDRCRRAYGLAMACRSKLIQCNLRLAVHIARRYGQHGSIAMADLIQDANVGLIKAVERYDPAKGFRFSTYAYWWISEEVRRCLQRGVRVVHTPENVVDEIRHLQKAALRLNQSLGRTPSQSELAQALEASPARIGELRALAAREVSTDAPLLDEGSITLGDSLAGAATMTPEYSLRHQDQRLTLGALMAELNQRERDILVRRYGLSRGEPETLHSISEQLGISRERVRQIEKSALRKLQQCASEQKKGA